MEMVSLDIIKEIELFEGLSDNELNSIAKLCYEEIYEADERIFRESDPAESLYVLIEGEVNIGFRLKEGTERLTVDTIREGEIFGWSVLVEPYKFSAAAITAKKSRVLVIYGEALRNLFEKNPHIGHLVMREIASVISSRLRHTRIKLLELLDSEKEGS